MGIIKTAMMSGVGIYGIKQLAKTQEHRHSSPNPNNYPRDYNNYPPQEPQGQGYWGPPGPPPRGPRPGQAPREDAYYGEYPDQQQRQWYPAQSQRPADGRYSGGYRDEKYTNQDGEYVYQARERQYANPPAYPSQQQGYGQQQGLPYGGASGAAGLLGTAMEFVGNQQGGDGKKSKKLGKGGDMINEFLGK
jgi:hypothetical protein